MEESEDECDRRYQKLPLRLSERYHQTTYFDAGSGLRTWDHLCQAGHEGHSCDDQGDRNDFSEHIKFLPFEYKFEDATNLKRYEREAKWKEMITLAALLSIFVSCIGLFGLATFNAETRVKEIGIRKVLGASVASITALLSADFIKLVLVAIVIAMPLAYYAVHIWLENFPYRIEISWLYFAFAGFLAIGVAILTVGYQSVKTAMLNPVRSLKMD
jgi:putative ABC transport system permease protein